MRSDVCVVPSRSGSFAERGLPLLKNKIEDGKTVYALEGLNGAGKSTLIKSLKSGRSDICTTYCVPGIFTEHKDLRHYISGHREPMVSPLFYLSGLAASASEIREIPGKFMILDRSIWSTLAAAYSKDRETFDLVVKMLVLLQGKIRIPDRVIMLRASFETCLERIMTKGEGKEFDKDSRRDFELKSAFYDILAQSGYPVDFVDTDGKSAEEVLEMFLKLLPENKPQSQEMKKVTEEFGNDAIFGL